MTNEQAQRDIPQINMDEWVRFGEGRMGESYYHVSDEDLMLKLYSAEVPFNEIKGEFERGFIASSLKLPVPTCYKMVAVGDKCGIIFQRVHDKVSIARAIGDDPSRIEEYVPYLVEVLRRINSTEADTATMMSISTLFSRAVDVSDYLSDTHKKRLLTFLRDVEGPTTCVHGDFHMGNAILARGKAYAIDLNMFGYGDPLFDVASLCYICTIASKRTPELESELYHMQPETMQELWRVFIRLYAGAETASQREEYEHMLLPYMRADLARKIAGAKFDPRMFPIMYDLMER